MTARAKGPGPWCGTAGGYSNHECHCQPCTKANTLSSSERRRQRYAERVVDGVGGWLTHPKVRRHGTVTAYQYWGCRCPLCKKKSSTTRQGTRIKPMPAVSYRPNTTGWTVRVVNSEILLGHVEMPSVHAGTWDAWAPLIDTQPRSLVATGLEGRSQAAEALWKAYSLREVKKS